MSLLRLPALLALALLSIGLSTPPAPAQTTPALKPLPNGIELTSGTAILQVTALRDDVLRVRAGHEGRLPEDASWAVLPEARKATVKVTPEDNGFHTAALRVKLDSDLRLTVTDLAGAILQHFRHLMNPKRMRN